MDVKQQVTQLLLRHAGGDAGATEELFALVYDDLHRLALGCMRAEAVAHTLQPTALVHEAYLRLSDGADVQWESRSHFLCVAARAMRHVLVDYARGRRTDKRGGGYERVTLSDESLVFERELDELLALTEALQQLFELRPTQARMAELRLFAGLSNEDVARTLELPLRTVQRHWQQASQWLLRQVEG